MFFRNEYELSLKIRGYRISSIVSIVAVFYAVFCFLFSVTLFIGLSYFYAVIYMIFGGIFVLYPVLVSKRLKREYMMSINFPYAIPHGRRLCYHDIKEIVSKTATVENFRDFDDRSAFFALFNKPIFTRVMAVHCDNFDKASFDSVGESVNKAIDTEYEVTNLLPACKVSKAMSINIIVTEEMTEELYSFISQNTDTLLKRAEGVINFVIPPDRLIVPPLFGKADLRQIGRYRRSVKLMKQLLA